MEANAYIFFYNAKSKLKTSTETETCRPTQIITQN